MVVATEQTTTVTLSFFNFLKEGLLLPSQNRRLFAAVFSIIAASSGLLVAVHRAAVQPLADEIRLDTTKALTINGTDPASIPDISDLIQEIQDDARALLLTGAAYLLFAAAVASAVRLVVLFAAVATYSGAAGEHPHHTHTTISSLLGKFATTAQLKGPLLTLAFVYALEIAYLALLAAMLALLVVLAIKQRFWVFCAWLLLLVPAVVFLVYFSFVCSLSVVVAVAEPGSHGAAALARAWRLMKGRRRRRQAALLISVTSLLAAAVFRVHALAKTCALTDKAAGLLLGFLHVVLVSAVQLFVVCAKAAFYYECKGRTDEACAPPEYLMVSTKEQFDA